MGYLKYYRIIRAVQLICCGQFPARVGVGAESGHVRVVRGVRLQRKYHVMHVIRANLLEIEQQHPVLQVRFIHFRRVNKVGGIGLTIHLNF